MRGGCGLRSGAACTKNEKKQKTRMATRCVMLFKMPTTRHVRRQSVRLSLQSAPNFAAAAGKNWTQRTIACHKYMRVPSSIHGQTFLSASSPQLIEHISKPGRRSFVPPLANHGLLGHGRCVPVPGHRMPRSRYDTVRVLSSFRPFPFVLPLSSTSVLQLSWCCCCSFYCGQVRSLHV